MPEDIPSAENCKWGVLCLPVQVWLEKSKKNNAQRWIEEMDKDMYSFQ